MLRVHKTKTPFQNIFMFRFRRWYDVNIKFEKFLYSSKVNASTIQQMMRFIRRVHFIKRLIAPYSGRQKGHKEKKNEQNLRMNIQWTILYKYSQT